MGHRESSHVSSGMGPVAGYARRRSISMGLRRIGAGGQQGNLSLYQANPMALVPTNTRHVGEPSNGEGEALRDALAACEGDRSGCEVLPFAGDQNVLCMPALGDDSGVDSETRGQSDHGVPNGGTHVGLLSVVAPPNAHARQAVADANPDSHERLVQRLPRDTYERAKVAPDLPGCLGQALAQQSLQAKAIADYFVPLESSIKRYCGAFRLLWALAELRGFDVVKISISDVAGLLLELHHVSPSQARNAYSACLLFPQWQGLKFSILLKTVKRSWYKSEPRYATFYDATSVFCKFPSQLLDRTNVESVRLRLILVWRFLGLYRGVDLSRVYRVVSVVDGQGMVVVRRKGQNNVKFEKVLSLADEAV